MTPRKPPDTGDTSDHRPVIATLDPVGEPTGDLRDSILEFQGRVEEIQELLDALRSRLAEIEGQLP